MQLLFCELVTNYFSSILILESLHWKNARIAELFAGEQGNVSVSYYQIISIGAVFLENTFNRHRID